MKQIVGVQFKPNGKTYYFDSNNVDLNGENKVIVETEKGLEFGFLVKITEKEKLLAKDLELSKIIRVASYEEEKKYEKNKKDAEKAIEVASNLAKDLNLSMTFVDSNFNFERSQLMLHFISEGRVDFRELVKQIATIYKTRIELRQIGVRDKAKEISGIGPCGRKICCSKFLKDLDSVSISMAKNQNIVLNPNKINGLCGRLLCCLNFEDELYKQNRISMPEFGDKVDTSFGIGDVIFIDIPNRKYIVNIPDHGKETIFLDKKCDKCGNCSK